MKKVYQWINNGMTYLNIKIKDDIKLISSTWYKCIHTAYFTWYIFYYFIIWTSIMIYNKNYLIFILQLNILMSV